MNFRISELSDGNCSLEDRHTGWYELYNLISELSDYGCFLYIHR